MPIAATHSAHMVMAVTCHSSRLGLQLRSSTARGPPQAAVSPPATVNHGALGKAVWRLYTAQKHGEACPWIPQERIARKGQEGVCHVASRITRLVPELSSSVLTAVSLQMAATNVPAHCMPGFYAACVARAQMLVPLCSLQELADLCWAFFRAQVVAPVEFHAGVLNAAQSWANACMSDNQAALVVSRESAHEAANFLFRLHKAGLLPPDCDLSRQMLHIVAAGTKQVRLVEVPGLLRKCQSSFGFLCTPASIRTHHSQRHSNSSPELLLPMSQERLRGLDFWEAAVAAATSDLQPELQATQYLFAAAASEQMATAPLSKIIDFAEQLLANDITEDQPMVVWSMEGLHERFAGRNGRLLSQGCSPNQLAQAVKKLAWAGLSSSEVTKSLSVALCDALLSDTQQPQLPPSHLVDTILQVADAGCDDERVFQVLETHFCNHPQLHREKPKALLRMAARLAAAGSASHGILQLLSDRLAAWDKKGFRCAPGLEFEQAAWEIRAGTFGPFSLTALKTGWNIARSLPRPPASYASGSNPVVAASGLEIAMTALDCTKPLVVDVGCGLGSFARAMVLHADVGIVGNVPYPGLQRNGKKACGAADHLRRACAGERHWNVLGLDVSPVAVRRCRAMAARDKMEGRVVFSETDALSAFDWLRRNYAGRIALVHIGFPTPFTTRGPEAAVGSPGGGNAVRTVHQKPDFMVHERMVTKIHRCLEADGLVFLQSNVEAVAVDMIQRFTHSVHTDAIQMSAVQCGPDCWDPSILDPEAPFTWLLSNPFGACSETEAATTSTGRKVWRCLLKSV